MKRFLVRGALVLVPLLLLLTYGLSHLGAWLVLEDPLQPADAIVVLGGTMYERPLEAVDLFNAGYAPRIYLLREMPDWGEEEMIRRGVPYMRFVDMQVDSLVRLGVPRQAIGILDPADSTAKEADYVRELVLERSITRVIVVTSKQHTRRARMVMKRRVSDIGAEVIVRASRYDQSNVDRWWQSRSTLRFTLFETQRLFSYWIGVAD